MSSQQPIPFLDLKRQMSTIKHEVMNAFDHVVSNTAFIGGQTVKRFEEEFARYIGVRHAIGVGNGTDALIYALKSLQIGPGDEVIVPGFTFIATWEAVSWVGATPIPVDADPETFTIDVKHMESLISPRTRAVIPVHIYGNVVDMDALLFLAQKYDLKVIEDAAQAHGAEYLTHYELKDDCEWYRNGEATWKKAGSLGNVSAFSFYPGKNLGAYGDAGGIVTNMNPLNERIRMLADHGSKQKYHHQHIGGNSRLDALQAAVLSVKLKYLDQWNQRRREIAARYNEAFRDMEQIQVMDVPTYARPVYHIYPVLVEKRDEVAAKLKEKGIFCGMHYPIANHLQPAYNSLGIKQGALPVTEKICSQQLSLPMFAELTDEEVDTVIKVIKELFS